MADYDSRDFWTSSITKEDGGKQNAIAISVDDRAATRQAIINALARKGCRLIERSEWHATPPKGAMRESHWDYRDIVIHHAGSKIFDELLWIGSSRRMTNRRCLSFELRKFCVAF
ncbi:hypothetical protein [Paraburkholderia sacchari]|uniref:hypothetical protein n=1 Tax=Paraburkholderia sacchari TaxID=159450 RepID=UPI001BD04B05|nr:hypothetical protein [Paraburkholderia sacchari]